MRKYFEWYFLPAIEDLERFYSPPSESNQHPVTGDFYKPDGSDINDSAFSEKAKLVKKWDEKNYCEINNADKIILDNISVVGGAKVVSQKAAERIKELTGDQVQLLPITIKFVGKKTRLQKGYSIVNPLVLLDCLDGKKTRFKIEDGKRRANPFRKFLFLEESKIDPDLKIFRLEYSRQMVVVNEDFVNFIREHKLLGFRFEEMNVI